MAEINEPVEITDADTQENDFSPEELESDTTDWKAKAEELKGIAKRRATQLAKLKEKLKATPESKPPEQNQPTPQKQPGDLDYGQKAFLASYGIKGSDELALVKNWVSRTGDEIDALVADDIFTAKLNGLREARASKDALPSSSKRAAPSAKDSVDYWLNKPFTDVPKELRTDVLNAKIKQQKNTDVFSSNPVVTN